MSKQEKVIITTPAFRLAFPEVFEARSFEEGKDGKFSITMLFPKDGSSLIPSLPGGGILPLRKLAHEALKVKFGADKAKWPGALKNLDGATAVSSTGKDGWPVRDGDMVEWDGFEGMFFARASSKFQPGIVNHKCQPIMDQSLVFGGLLCRAQISAWAYEAPQSKGVNFSLENLQILKDDGVSFDGKRQRAEDAFSAFDDGTTGNTQVATSADFE
jgi:hypothetical protein